MSEEDIAEIVESKRIFVNKVDSYEGKNIAKYLSECVVGASLEGDDEEEDAKSIDSTEPVKPKLGTFLILGSVQDQLSPKPAFISEILNYENRSDFYEHVVECDVIIYNINERPEEIDEAIWLVSEIHANLEKIDRQKIFILVSSVMTWARSKPLDPEDPEIPFTDDDYRRRKCHPNFKEHLSAEKTILKLGKTNKQKLVTYVVAAGLTYGHEEYIFHYLFKGAWHNSLELQCFGDGKNILPTIHVSDLAAVLQNIADGRPKTKYIIACDDSQNTSEEIVRAVSSALGTGKYRFITKEEALLNREIEQADFDKLLLDLRMDAVFVKESLHIRWKSEGGINENIQMLVKEFKDARNLVPLKIIVLGPPAVGKTTVVKQLCDHYKLHHIHMKKVVEEGIDRLEKLSSMADQPTTDEEEEVDPDAENRAQEAQELLDTINESKDQATGKIEDQYVIRFFRETLFSKPCQNQGFIIDGFPKTLDQAKELFAVQEEEEEEEGIGDHSYDQLIMPQTIISLDASDEFLKNRIMMLPERDVQGTHNTEEGLLRRLLEYRQLNTEDDTLLNYFDELEIHPDYIDVTNDESVMHKDTVEKIKGLVGNARNYGPTLDEIAEMRRQEEEQKLKEAEEHQKEIEKREADEAAERRRRHDEWQARLEDVKKEEYELLEAQSEPLRNYLMKHVMPTLTQGLIEACKVRPEDPVDFLAEYLFKNNPQID